MACVIGAPASGSGKTLLSLLLSSWARCKGVTLQPFKVGPDYLDPQHLTLVSEKPCRNLDLILCGKEWVQKSFYTHSSKSTLTLIEGVMGLFDGIGSSHEGSTAHISKVLNLPIVLIVDAKGQAASIAALVKGFKDLDDSLEIAGVVLNHVNTDRHKKLLIEALSTINIKVVGCLPTIKELSLPSKFLGLAPAHEIKSVETKIKHWDAIAKSNLDINFFENLLRSPDPQMNSHKQFNSRKALNTHSISIAIAEDKAFHFRYPETKEYLEYNGIKTISWQLINDEPIPKEAKGLIIPGGYPEQFANQISESKKALSSIRNFFGSKPIYAECGGMLILGESLQDINGQYYPMAGLLPFKSKEGKLSVGYRKLKTLEKGLISSKGECLIGHEFHRWEIESSLKLEIQNKYKNHTSIANSTKTYQPWKVSGWGINSKVEGWSNKMFHASWMHLHWPSSKNILNNWTEAINSARKL